MILSSSCTPATSSAHFDQSDAFPDLPTPAQARQVDMLPSTTQPSMSTQLPPSPASVVHPPIPPPQVMPPVITVSTEFPTGPQPMLQRAATPAIHAPLANPTAPLQDPVPMASGSAILNHGPALAPAPAIQPVPNHSAHVITSALLTHSTLHFWSCNFLWAQHWQRVHTLIHLLPIQ